MEKVNGPTGAPRLHIPLSVTTQRFQADSPMDTHWEGRHCKDVDCPNYISGFKVILDESDADQKAHAERLRTLRHGRHYRELREVEGLTTFYFPPGQRCFAKHRVKTDKPPILTRRRVGDIYRHQNGRDWNEDMNTEVDRAVRSRR